MQVEIILFICFCIYVVFYYLYSLKVVLLNNALQLKRFKQIENDAVNINKLYIYLVNICKEQPKEKLTIKQNFNNMQKDNLKNITPTDANNVLVAGLSTLKAHYIIGNKTGCCQPETIHFQRKGAIAKFIEGSNMTWEDCVKSGWQVYKVDVVFQPCH